MLKNVRAPTDEAPDQVPIRDPLDVTGKKGDTCQFDLACGWGGVCVRTPGSCYGTCL